MIDIIQALQHRNPALGPYVIVLRGDSRARHPTEPDNLSPEAQAWLDAHAPGARLSTETVLIAPYPGAMPSERILTVLAFADARQLAAFATAWTGDAEEEPAEG
ncbi:hypothetical protein [Methylobacterium sp. Leaf466]|uniref:hypothetical protein n=1 Tax=Methylobacterium sp. Leaf466 TaxID=1736386 RepID=UPI0006F56CD6|nr:hypothetical protein [Methylobacterium sp. Leaf466]KQT84458.1 hypothetical protein ASG59_03550 [Methylobacterium sp. Leaf466]